MPLKIILNQSVQNTSGVSNTSETKHVTNKNSSLISAEDAQSRMQLLVNANNGEGCSVEYPKLNSQKTVYHAAVNGMDGYIGDIYINSQTGNLIKLSGVHD